MMVFTWDDLKRLLVSQQKKIVRWSLWCSSLALIITLFLPPQYETWATFKQSNSRENQTLDLKNLIHTFSSGGSEASSKTLMLSNRVLGKTVENLGLQAELKLQSRWKILLGCIYRNIFAECGIQIQDPNTARFSSVVYPGETPLTLKFQWLSDKEYELHDQSRRLRTKGVVGQPLVCDAFELTLDKAPWPKLQTSTLTLHPLPSTTRKLRQKISIRATREDKNLLRIVCKDTDRKRCSQIINTLMDMYEQYLIDENKIIIGAQLSYLRQRQDTLSAKFDQDIQQHAQTLQTNLKSQGFLGIKDEIKFVLEPLQAYQQRLYEVEIELLQIEQRLAQHPIELIPATHASNLVKKYSTLLGSQIDSVRNLIVQVQQKQPLSLPLNLENLQLLSQEFNKALQSVDIHHPSTDQILQSKQKEVETVLQNLIEHLAARQQALLKGSEMVQSFETNLTGIRLESARTLFDHYSKQFNDLHTQMKQLVFIRDHLFDPHFEISTLSNLLSDPVTEHMVQRSSELETQLCDDLHHSSKDRLRLKNTLTIHKRFLDSHLEQTLQLNKIRIELIQEKISSLSTIMKTLLEQEKEVLQEKMGQIKQSMQVLPDLWVNENRLQFRSELTKAMMEGLVHITETKNLSDYLYQVESRPLDPAIPPIAPIAPRLVIKTWIVFMLSMIACGFFVLIQSLTQGLSVSLTTLSQLGQHVCGTLSSQSPLLPHSMEDQDVETIRRIVSFLMENKIPQPKVVAILGEKQTRYFPVLTAFLKRHHRTCCVVDCNFGKIISKEEEMGLFQILQGMPFKPLLQNFESYDFLPVGSSSDASVELLQSIHFQTLVEQLAVSYDYLFLLSRTPLESLETDALIHLSHRLIVTVDTTLASLQKKFDFCRQKEKKYVTYIQHSMKQT